MRRCDWCHSPIDHRPRKARFCSDAHKMAHHRYHADPDNQPTQVWEAPPVAVRAEAGVWFLDAPDGGAVVIGAGLTEGQARAAARWKVARRV